MFKFSLEALHKVRKRKEEEKQKELAYVMNALQQEKGALEGFNQDISNKLKEELESNTLHYDNNVAILYDRFIAGRKTDIQDKTELIERINEVVVEKRQDVLKAYINRKVIDNFKNRKYEEYLTEEKKMEAKDLGEMVTMGFKRFRAKAQTFTLFLLSFSLLVFPACGGKKQVAEVDKMNQQHEAAQLQEQIIHEEESVQLLRDTLKNQNLQNQQLLIEMANLKEKMIEMERLQGVQETVQVQVKVENPVTHETVVETKETYEPKTLYKLGYNAIRDKKYQEARNYFNDFILQYPTHFLADNCLYWIGESYYDEKDYKTAIHYFQKIQQDYPKGNKVPDGLLKTGYSYYSLGRNDVALKTINDFIATYPESSLRPLADKMLSKLQGTP